MADTISVSLSKVSDELKSTNLQYSKATEQYRSALAAQSITSGALKGVGGAIKENLISSASGFSSFIDQLEQMPVFGAISKIGKTLGGKMFSALRQRKEDANLAKRLGITKQEVVMRRKEQEFLRSQEEANKTLLNAAELLGYTPEQFEKLTGAKETQELSAAEVEKSREDRRANERLVSAVEGVGDGINNLELEEDGESKGFLGGILDGIKGFIPAIGAALVSLGTTLLGGLVALGTKIVLALKGGLGGVGKLLKKLPGGRALGNIFKKSLGGIARLGTAGAGLLSTGASAAGAGVKTAGGMAGTALKGIGKAAKFIPGAGLAVTAAMGLFDGLTAGFKEYSESGSFTSALKEGTAGALSGITFGLVSQETISNGMSAIGDFAKKGWDGFTNLAGGAMEGLSNIGSSVGGWFSSWWSDEEEGIKDENQNAGGIIGSVTDSVKATASSIVDTVGGTLTSAAEGFNNLTGLNVPTNLTEIKDMVGGTLTSVAEGFTNLTGIEVPRSWADIKETAANAFNGLADGFTSLTGIEVPRSFAELADGFTNLTGIEVPRSFAEAGQMAKDTFDKIGSGFTNLTGIEVPTFDDLRTKVSEFANNMKENISKGWESVKDTAGSWWKSAKSMVGLGGDDEKVEPNKEKLEKLNDQKMLNDMEMEEISNRMDKMESRGGPKTRSQRKQYEKDQARFDELIKEDDKIDREIAKLQQAKEPSTPYDYPIQYSRLSDGKFYYVYNKGEGQIEVAPNQEEAKRIYESASISVSPSSAQQGTILERSNSAAAQISREYMQNGGNTTVVNAPNNSVTNSGGGGQTVLPMATKDNSSSAARLASVSE